MSDEERNKLVLDCLKIEEGKERLGETMIMPLLNDEHRAMIQAKHEAMDGGCVVTKEEKEV